MLFPDLHTPVNDKNTGRKYQKRHHKRCFMPHQSPGSILSSTSPSALLITRSSASGSWSTSSGLGSSSTRCCRTAFFLVLAIELGEEGNRMILFFYFFGDIKYFFHMPLIYSNNTFTNTIGDTSHIVHESFLSLPM